MSHPAIEYKACLMNRPRLLKRRLGEPVRMATFTCIYIKICSKAIIKAPGTCTASCW